jgi:hypothetical protein
MSRTILAAALALLAFTVPAHAGFLIDESFDLNFGNGYQAIGELDLVVAAGVSADGNVPTLYLDFAQRP